MTPLHQMLALFVLALALHGVQGWNPVTVGRASTGGDGPDGSGACGYGTLSAESWPYDAIAVVNPASSLLSGAGQQGCGACLQIQCTDEEVCGNSKTPFVVFVTDNCDGCDTNQLYVSPAAYDTGLSSSIGTATGRAQLVNCEPPGDIVIRIDQYRASLGGYLRLVLLSVAGSGAVTSVELRPSGSGEDWIPMQASFGAAWDASSLPSTPLDVKITRGSDSVIAANAIKVAGQTGDILTGVQFGGASEATVNSVGAVPALEPSPEVVPPVPEPIPEPTLEPTPNASAVISLLPVTPPEAEALAPPAPEAEPALGLLPAPEEEGGPASSVILTPVSPSALVSPAAEAEEEGSPVAEEPSITPAPVQFIPADAPTLPAAPPKAGPLSAAAVAASDPAFSTSNCSSVLATLKAIPEVSTWVQVLTNVGLSVLLDAPDAQATLLVPTNSALNARIRGGSVRGADTLAALLNAAPDLANPLAAYHVVKGLWPSNTLSTGTKLPTSATLDKVNLLELTINADGSIQGVGSSADILQADILACGPSVIHIIDQVLLPFNFDQASLDAITATQVPSPPPVSPSLPAAAGRRLLA